MALNHHGFFNINYPFMLKYNSPLSSESADSFRFSFINLLWDIIPNYRTHHFSFSLCWYVLPAIFRVEMVIDIFNFFVKNFTIFSDLNTYSIFLKFKAGHISSVKQNFQGIEVTKHPNLGIC